MDDEITVEPGQQVCVVGHGTAVTLHMHPTVLRLTKTLIVTDDRRRHRRTGLIAGSAQSVPYRPYGGTQLAIKCQRPKRDAP